jgi:hypothetical protein
MTSMELRLLQNKKKFKLKSKIFELSLFLYKQIIFDLMNLEKLDKNEIFLLTGDDYKNITSSKLYKTSYLSIEFYVVDKYKIIESISGYKCSCDNLLCWHIIKVITDKKKAVNKDGSLDDFL